MSEHIFSFFDEPTYQIDQRLEHRILDEVILLAEED
jgi:hypothetical protein